MTEPEVFFSLGMAAMALWRRQAVLTFLAGITALAFGLKHLAGSWHFGAPLLALGLVLFYHGVILFWRR